MNTLREGPAVALVAPLPPPYGGIAHWTRLIVRHAECSGRAQVQVINTAPPERSVDGRTIWQRVVGQGLRMVRNVADLHRSINQCRPDVVHLVTSGSLGIVRDVAIAVLARLHRVPAVYHIHFGRVPALARGRSLEWFLLGVAMRLCGNVLALDHDTHDAVRRHLPRVRVTIVPNPIDVSALPDPMQDASQVVAFVGWVVPKKGIGELLQAWEQVAVGRPKWTLRLIGPVGQEYRSVADESNLTRVEFVGEKPHAQAVALLNDAQIFVLPSHTEAFPNAVLEAMALQKAIVATRVGAIPDMLDHHSGVLVGSRDVAGLARSLARVMDDAEERHELGARARRRVIEEYVLDRVFSLYLDVWSEACRPKVRERA